MLVIDASVLVDALLVAGQARARLASNNLQAPELIDAELLSVLRRLVLADKLRDGHALQALATAHRLGLRRSPSRSLWPRAWELRTHLSAYDALYVALAEQLQAPLLTAHARLARACQATRKRVHPVEPARQDDKGRGEAPSLEPMAVGDGDADPSGSGGDAAALSSRLGAAADCRRPGLLAEDGAQAPAARELAARREAVLQLGSRGPTGEDERGVAVGCLSPGCAARSGGSPWPQRALVASLAQGRSAQSWRALPAPVPQPRQPPAVSPGAL